MPSSDFLHILCVADELERIQKKKESLPPIPLSGCRRMSRIHNSIRVFVVVAIFWPTAPSAICHSFIFQLSRETQTKVTSKRIFPKIQLLGRCRTSCCLLAFGKLSFWLLFCTFRCEFTLESLGASRTSRTIHANKHTRNQSKNFSVDCFLLWLRSAKWHRCERAIPIAHGQWMARPFCCWC